MNVKYFSYKSNVFYVIINSYDCFIRNPYYENVPNKISVSVKPEDSSTQIGSDGYLVADEPEWRSNYRGDYKNLIIKPSCTHDLLCWSFQVARGMEYLASRKVCS